MSTIPFTNFTKGEIAPELQARIDTKQYQAGARRVSNFIIQKYGGLSFRPGFRYVGEASNAVDTVRYVPFQFNMEQSYVIAFENLAIEFLAQGGMVLEDDLKITGITKEVNAKITAAYHGYGAGTQLYLDGIVGMTELNKRKVWVTSVIDTHNFRIDIDTTTYGTFVSSSGMVRTGPPSPPAPYVPTPSAPTPPPPTTSTGGGSGLDTTPSLVRRPRSITYWNQQGLQYSEN